MNLDADLYSPRNIPLQSARVFITKTLPHLGWGKNEGEEVVLDVGCGPGGTTKNLILPLFSSSSRIFAMDAVPDMIALAKKHNSSPQIEYSVANIEDWSSLERWKNQITKLVSISVFQWLKDQRKGFYHVHQLLQKGGEAAFYFPVQTPFYTSLIEMQNSPKWRDYFNGVETFIPESQHDDYDAKHYEKMLDELGFKVLYCKREEETDIFASDEEFREFFTSICVLRKYVPTTHLGKFEEEFIEKMHQYNGRTIDGRPFHKGNFLELVVRKISAK